MSKDQSRYSRQVILKEIGEEGQDKLSNAKVLVIGAGGLGCPVLSYLASAGTGTIGILDFDTVERSNLHRQILFDESQIGIPKAEAALEKLKSLNSEITFHSYNTFVNSKNGPEILRDYQIVIDATDNFKTRYLINDLCVNLGKPFVMGSINKFEGQISVFNFDGGPAYTAVYPDLPGNESIANCEESGVIGSLCGIIGSLMATEVIKIITGSGKVLSGEILVVDSLNMNFHKIKFHQSPLQFNKKELKM